MGGQIQGLWGVCCTAVEAGLAPHGPSNQVKVRNMGQIRGPLQAVEQILGPWASATRPEFLRLIGSIGAWNIYRDFAHEIRTNLGT